MLRISDIFSCGKCFARLLVSCSATLNRKVQRLTASALIFYVVWGFVGAVSSDLEFRPLLYQVCDVENKLFGLFPAKTGVSDRAAGDFVGADFLRTV